MVIFSLVQPSPHKTVAEVTSMEAAEAVARLMGRQLHVITGEAGHPRGNYSYAGIVEPR
jgi:hypothetical protein